MKLQHPAKTATAAAVIGLLMLLSPIAASAATNSASSIRVPHNKYTAVMISDSLGTAFTGVSRHLDLAEGIAYNKCLRTANNNPDYQGDCTKGIWVRNGFIVAFTSGPYTNEIQPFAWGAGEGRTYSHAARVALSECRDSGGQHCRFDTEWAPKTPIPARARTTGGVWNISGGVG